jgi:hypothetical protein
MGREISVQYFKKRALNMFIFSTITSVADPDPGSGAFLTPVSGMEKIQIWDSGSGINIPNNIF